MRPSWGLGLVLLALAGCGGRDTPTLPAAPTSTPAATPTAAGPGDGPQDAPCFRLLFRDTGAGSCTLRLGSRPARVSAVPAGAAAKLATLRARLHEVKRPERLPGPRGRRRPELGKAFVVARVEVTNRSDRPATMGGNLALQVGNRRFPVSPELRASPRPAPVAPGAAGVAAYVFEIPRRPHWQLVAQSRPCVGVVVSDFGTLADPRHTQRLAWLRLGAPTVTPERPDPTQPCGA